MGGIYVLFLKILAKTKLKIVLLKKGNWTVNLTFTQSFINTFVGLKTLDTLKFDWLVQTSSVQTFQPIEPIVLSLNIPDFLD